MSVVLGLNAYHGDAAASLVVDGRVVAAAEEERFRRVKHWAGYPREAIAFCIKELGSSIADVDIVAINSDPSLHRAKKVKHVLSRPSSILAVPGRLRNAAARSSLLDLLQEQFDGSVNATVKHVPHHLAHLASAFYPSGFKSSALVSIDGFGDFSSGCWGFGHETNIDVASEILYPHSLGVFYQAITQFLGFPNFGDEYKVMGLAPYGDPKFLEQMESIVRLTPNGGYELELDYFKFHRENINYEWESGSPVVGDLFADRLETLFGRRRSSGEELTQEHKDIAASAQLMFERALFHILKHVKKETESAYLCLAGGCGNNSVANGKIRKAVGFDKIYVPASAGDAGGAIGAALVASAELTGALVDQPQPHAYVGPKFNNEAIRECIDTHASDLPKHRFRVSEPNFDQICDVVTSALVEGNVVGWFQGGMEWGPRALGNRSILGDPRRSDMKDILNLKIKRRESFRPFAPSILREYVQEWFEEDDDVPFMMKVFPIKPDKRALIPAVTHVDGSGRLQTVHRNTNARYHQLISTFKDKTGVPILLNTSFNENEPVVCTPQEALSCFLRTNMDVLVMNDFIIERV